MPLLRSPLRPAHVLPAFGLGIVCCLAGQGQIQGAGTAQTGPQRPTKSANPGLLEREYRLQAGDAVSVTFRFTPEFNEDATILPDGQVTLKATGGMVAAGLTPRQLEEAITRASSTKLVHAEVAVTLKDFDRPHVYVAGEVNTPGRQELRQPTTVLQAILMCGGAKEDAALGRVLLLRHIDAETAEVHVLQLAHYSRRARGENDMLLQPNDMVLVRHDLPSRIERVVKVANLGFYLNPLQNVAAF